MNSRISKKNDELNKNELDTKKMAFIAAKAAEDKKASDVLLLGVNKVSIISDYFLIVSASSNTQIQAISNHIELELKNFGYKLFSREGKDSNNWIILDFGDLIVHVMLPETRDYYKLESFWSNATFVENNIWKKAS